MDGGAQVDTMPLLFHPKERSPESVKIIHISESNNNNLNLLNPFFLGTQNRVKFVMKHSVPLLHPELYTVYGTQQACCPGFEAPGPARRTLVSKAVSRQVKAGLLSTAPEAEKGAHSESQLVIL